jgi:hypothetical protein
MIRNFALFIFLLLSFTEITHAELESQFNFIGQNSEVLKAEKKVSLSVPQTIQVPSTCTRSVPDGEVEVCANETRYRQECSWVPSSQRCWNERDRVCRSIPRTRQECTSSPGQTVCTNRPSRQVCTERPTREVCTTRPDGRQHCTTVGGGTHCTTVGGGQDCRQVPGQTQCRTVTYNDVQCDDIVRNRCETVPGRNECRNIPYQERVCRTETQYRSETYACTRPQTTTVIVEKTIKAETQVQILTNGLAEEFPVRVALKDASSDFSAFNLEVKLLKEPKLFVLMKKKKVSVVATENLIEVKGELQLEVVSLDGLSPKFPEAIARAFVSQASKKLIVSFEGPLPAVGEVDLLIFHNTYFSPYKTIAELKSPYPKIGIGPGVLEGKAALSIDLKDALKDEFRKKNMRLRLSLSAPSVIEGEILNQARPSLVKTLDEIFVDLME